MEFSFNFLREDALSYISSKQQKLLFVKQGCARESLRMLGYSVC